LDRARLVGWLLLSRAVRGRNLRGLLGSTWLLAIVLLVTTWPVESLAPATALDPSWQAALHMAAHNRMGFGDDLMFSFGPLGFLNFPQLYYQDTAGLAALYLVGARFAICFSLLWAARQTMPLLLAFAFTLITASILTFTEDAVSVPVLIWCAAALLSSKETPAVRMLPIAGGIVAGIEMLGKLNIGVAVFGMLALTILALPNYRRGIAAFASTFLVTLLAGWLVTGGSLSQLWPFFLNVVSIFSGYSSAMQYDDPDRPWWLTLAIITVAGIGLAGALSSSRGLDRRRRLALVLLWTLFAFVVFKESFVRQDPTRKAIFFGLTLAALFAFRWRPGRQFLSAPALALVLVFYFGSTHARFRDVVHPRANADRAFHQFGTMVRRSRRQSVLEQARNGMYATYGLDPKSRRLIGDAPAHVYPHETTVAWAYQLNWHPLPVFQTYAAYTERLDHLNARALSSSNGPEMILRRPDPAIDARNGTFDSPAAVLAMICNYEELRATAAWEVLRRTSNRCGPSRPLESVKAKLGETVQVPAPPDRGDLVFARVHGIQVSGIERLRAAVFRAHLRHVAINGTTVYRFVPNTGADGLLLRMPVRADYSGLFSFSKAGPAASGNAKTIAFFQDVPPRSQPHKDLKIEFYAMPIRAAPGQKRR
jgi:hypothetical protein